MDSAFPIVAVIGGTGAEGSAIALRLGHAGCRVVIGTRNLSKGERVAEELNGMLGKATVSFAENVKAAAAAEIVILTVPYNAERSTVEEIRGVLENKILIDATVPLMPPKVGNVQLPQGGSAVAAIQESPRRKGSRGIGLSERRGAQTSRTWQGRRVRCSGVRQRCQCPTNRARPDNQNGPSWHRCRTDLQFGGGRSADVSPDILKPKIQGVRFRHQTHRPGESWRHC